MFDEASKQEKGENSDLVPYWSLANINEETIKIERIVPMYPSELRSSSCRGCPKVNLYKDRTLINLLYLT